MVRPFTILRAGYSVIKGGGKVTVAEVQLNLKDLKNRIIKGGHGFASRGRGGGGAHGLE